MRLAVFDHVGNWGGGMRFARALLLALKQTYPTMDLTYFGNRASMRRENLSAEFLNSGIAVRYLASASPPERSVAGTITRAVLNKLGQRFPSLPGLPRPGQVHREIEEVGQAFDLAFFPWPYFLECPNLRCPMVGVFHDFNYKYTFGAPTFTQQQFDALNLQIPSWLDRVTPVVSSKFSASELGKFYPQFAHKVRIVHLAPFSIGALSREHATAIVRDMGLSGRYLLYPTNLCSHKNVGSLLHAMYLVGEHVKDIRLLVTGPGTECLTGQANRYGIDRSSSDKTIIGLGYVTNEQIDALIQCATAVVSTSLYEAGNGPGLEAWLRGVPVLMSNIPSFVEHLDVLGVKAKIFDPTSPSDIAEKIMQVLSDPATAQADADYSQAAIRKHSWDVVAANYQRVFADLSSDWSAPVQ